MTLSVPHEVCSFLRKVASSGSFWFHLYRMWVFLLEWGALLSCPSLKYNSSTPNSSNWKYHGLEKPLVWRLHKQMKKSAHFIHSSMLYRAFSVSFSTHMVLGYWKYSNTKIYPIFSIVYIPILKFKVSACKFTTLGICIRRQRGIIKKLQSGFNAIQVL